MRTAVRASAKSETAESEHFATQTLQSQINISIFLGILILTVFVMPSLGMGQAHELRYGSIVSSILLIAGISITWRRRGLFIFSALVGSVAIGIRWFSLFDTSRTWMMREEAATLVVIFLISWILILQIFRHHGPVTAVSVQAAIAIYLLFGIAWSYAYLIAMQLNPHAFQSTVALSTTSTMEWFYYSFVTLTTLGYGEITPATQITRMMAVGEALTGQLYLAVLIARLIGMEIVSSQQKADRSSR